MQPFQCKCDVISFSGDGASGYEINTAFRARADSTFHVMMRGKRDCSDTKIEGKWEQYKWSLISVSANVTSNCMLSALFYGSESACFSGYLLFSIKSTK